MKKANLISDTISALGTLKKLRTIGNFLTALRRGLKQQNSVTNKSFVRNPNELLNFFCENDTKLKWDMVQDNLVDFENSRIDLGTIEIDELLTASSVLLENVVTFISELPFTVTSEKVRKMFKLMPVIYFKNNQYSTFLNLHEFVFTPGIFESMFVMTEEDEAVAEAPSEESEVGTRTKDRSGFGGRPSIFSKFTVL